MLRLEDAGSIELLPIRAECPRTTTAVVNCVSLEAAAASSRANAKAVVLQNPTAFRPKIFAFPVMWFSTRGINKRNLGPDAENAPRGLAIARTARMRS